MKINKQNYSFDDEIILKSVFDYENKQIVVFFESFYRNTNFVKVPCRLIIKNWKKATKNEYGKNELFSLGKNLEMFELLLSIEKLNDYIILIVNTVNGKYLELRFKNADISIIEEPDGSDM